MMRIAGNAVAKSVKGATARSFATAAGNDVKVAATESHHDDSLTATVSLVVNAGSRFETVETTGAAHFLKNWAFRNTVPRTSFRTIREAELQGATLYSEATREHIIYTVECFKQDVPFFVEVLGDVATATKYAQHEFDQIAKQVHIESASARASPVLRVIDDLHSAAFRSGLGNSLYAPPSSPIANSEQVKAYAESAFTAPRVAIIGTGIGAQALTSIVSSSSAFSSLASAASAPAPSPAKFFGGQSKHADVASSVFHYALGFEAPRDPATAKVLAELLGTGPRTKWGQGLSPLAQLSSKVGAQIEAFSITHSDTGLVGVIIAAPAEKITDVAKQTVEEIKKFASGTLSESELQRAVASARLQLAIESESRSGVRHALIRESFSQKAATNFDALNTQSVSQALGSLLKSKPSAASFGNALAAPYLDTIGF
ncbi:ubiquinol-cytochrome c reductase core subunit 1 [Spiromyces aspiralis]|uniref:Ubiquinol-cytochrome c reductase core subunit 1 n=1 Tax=Spiromyces aspiralis TaxID=68401 RepID=A0ACC1HKR5_9FUNG|nr:ubiquinol-cytochrome c reductase core subunit 1 [Spiromyces aspiralis]